jgi:hypothetical protein
MLRSAAECFPELSLGSNRTKGTDSTTPTANPPTPTSIVSVNNCRTMRPRPAPRGAYTHFAGPFGGTRQQEIHYIPAGNQQHQANTASSNRVSGRTGSMEIPVKLSTNAPHSRGDQHLSDLPHIPYQAVPWCRSSPHDEWTNRNEAVPERHCSGCGSIAFDSCRGKLRVLGA